MKRKVIRLGSRRIKVYFDDKYVDEYEKVKGNKGYCHAFCDRKTDTIYVRESLSLILKRMALLHELTHLVFDYLNVLDNETLAELNARYIDELFMRNGWIRKMYLKGGEK